ncbi:general odorant-binding protein 28a-like [Drosophila serrata]|uniref:general odorant-binding protein 28a-like n=1 Tax=Drosophila serrata TaxID=7274 RepID=UPI000A1D16D4|nr:general odorant-binding protein 28a-like [Drosophila serrata]XP_020809329.1 general odorant-binding protein 28a-like [Drosophila serrata]XP_020809396.1 general odorant-binding protein 28a-like [Drosophila serrata]
MQRLPIIFLAVLLLSVAILVRGFDEKEAMAKLMESAESCLGQVGAAQSDLQDLVKKQPASTYQGKCLRACVMKSFGLLDSSGKLDIEAGHEKAKQYTGDDPTKLKIALEIGDTCAAISVPEDHCEAAEAYGICFKSEATKHGLM